MEPLQNDTAPDAPDQGLDDAASALESQLPPGAAESLPATPAAPPAPARPGREALHSQWRGERQAGYLRRREIERRQHAATAAEKKRYEEQLASSTRTMEQVTKLLQDRFPDQAEKIDLFAEDAADKLAGLLQGRQEAALKPILDFIKGEQERRQQEAEQAELQAFQEEARQALTSEYQAELREYVEASPYAFGVEDRVKSWVAFKAGVYQRAGYEPQDAQNLALLQIHHHFEHNRRQGINGVEAVDQFVCAEFDAMGFDPIDPEDDLGDQQPTAPPPPPRTEAGRLARVQERTRGAAATGPRAPERVSTERGELETLVAGGETDMRKLQAAALADAGGDAVQAALLLSRAFAMPLQW